MAAYLDRVSRLQKTLRDHHLAGAVLAPTDQMRYLTGWAESGHERFLALLVPAEGSPVFVVPAINAEQAKTNLAGIADVRGWEDAEGWHDAARSVLCEWDFARKRAHIGRGLAIDDELDSVHLLAIQRLLPAVPCVPAGDLMASLREIKSADELAAMEHSARVTDEVFEESMASIREGMTELDLQDAIAQGYRRRGTRPDFAIVCFGAHSALPHHSPGTTRLKRGDVVLIDMGCDIEGYDSDITRTLAFGRPEPEVEKVYEIVYAAHRAALQAGKPGVACEDVDRAARQVIEEAGYGNQFIHRTGHGIGLSGHEPPYIVKRNAKPLREGMCFSDEPGVYLPGRFGVRIENIVTVTRDGLRYLNAAPPDRLRIIEPAAG